MKLPISDVIPIWFSKYMYQFLTNMAIYSHPLTIRTDMHIRFTKTNMDMDTHKYIHSIFARSHS